MREGAAVPRVTLVHTARQVAIGVVLPEVLLLLGIVVLGYPGFGEAPWYQEALRTSQQPGILLVQAVGLCCGYSNSLILTDVLGPHWGALEPDGLPYLAAANVLVVSAILILPVHAWRRRSGALDVAQAVSARAP